MQVIKSGLSGSVLMRNFLVCPWLWHLLVTNYNEKLPASSYLYIISNEVMIVLFDFYMKVMQFNVLDNIKRKDIVSKWFDIRLSNVHYKLEISPDADIFFLKENWNKMMIKDVKCKKQNKFMFIKLSRNQRDFCTYVFNKSYFCYQLMVYEFFALLGIFLVGGKWIYIITDKISRFT